MKKLLGIVGVTFVSALSLVSIREVQYFLYGMLGLLFLFSIGAGWFGILWIRQFVEIKKEEKLIKKAERQKAERDSEHSYVLAKDNEQLHIRETNHDVTWRNATIDTRTYANGSYTQPCEAEVAAWMAWTFKNKPQNLPQLIGQSEEPFLLESGEQKRRNLLDIKFIHMLIVGPTGSGKTTIANWQIDNFPQATVVYALDPHEGFNTWSPRANVIGEGRNYKAIDTRMISFINEMDRRFSSGKKEFRNMLIVVDEWLSVLDNCKHAERFLKIIGSESRKVDITLIIMTISSTVEDLNCSAAVRENLVQLKLDRSLQNDNLAELKWSRKDTEIVELPGIYVPGRQTIRNDSEDAFILLDSGPVAINSSIEEELNLTHKQSKILELWRNGITDRKEISETVYGTVGGSQYQTIDKVLLRAGLM